MACPFKPDQDDLNTKDEVAIKEGKNKDIAAFLENLKGDYNNLLKHAAWRGDGKSDWKFSMRDINTHLRENYQCLMKNVGENIFPVVFANDGDPGQVGTGTTWTVHERNGSIKRYYRTNEHYEFYKALSHQLFGVFTYVGPFMNSPDSIAWIEPLKGFQTKVRAALHLVKPKDRKPDDDDEDKSTEDFSSTLSKLSALQAKDAHFLLKAVDDYITDVTEKRKLSLEGYKDLAKKMMPGIEKNMKTAVELQVKAFMVTLKEIKENLGEEEWKQAYFLVPTVWPVSGVNPRMQALQLFMEAGQFRTHVISAMNNMTYEEATVTLGRIVGDRALAQIVFGNDTHEMRKHVFALSTPQDLMADDMDDALAKYDYKDVNDALSEWGKQQVQLMKNPPLKSQSLSSAVNDEDGDYSATRLGRDYQLYF